MRKENIEIITSVIAASFFVLLLVVAIVFLFRIYVKRKNKLLLEKKMMGIQFEQTLLQSQLEIQEQTFNNISREIHDNIGQVLSLVRINLNTLSHPSDPEKIGSMDELLGKALTDLRNLSHSLDADHIRTKGWVPPVVKLLEDLNRTGKYEVQIEIAQGLPPLGNEKPIILFRMIQEIVNNIIRHAGASKIRFSARKDRERLAISIADDGKGFDKSAEAAGVGLRNLANRSKMINAELSINSNPGNGTEVLISIKPENLE